MLSAALLSTSMPLYASLARTPEEIFFGEGVQVVSQATRDFPLTLELVEEIRAQDWAIAVSPEVYAFIAVEGRAVVVRGIEVDSFLRLEGIGAELDIGTEFLLLGRGLADDLGVRSGDNLLLPGSLRPLLMEAIVDDVLDLPGAAADEMLMDLPRTRLLAGLGPESITLVRVGVEDGQELLDYLVSSNADLLVGDGQGSLRVEEGRVLDDRIGALLLTRPELAQELGRSYISVFAQSSGNSLRVLVLGMEVLTFALFTLIFVSSLVRFLVENRRSVGLIVALGGRLRALLSTYGRKILGLGLLAGFLGFIIGMGIGVLLDTIGAFKFFGHVLRYSPDPWQAFILLSLYTATLLLALILSLLFLLVQRPRDLLYEPPERKFEEVEGEPG
ncbi:MAG: hypothetical protein LN412_02695 [Candidatus Thermoplasmatota archaeon]|nr:hypothetical protein [Candidatus Thermoplasmatota archaeon]